MISSLQTQKRILNDVKCMKAKQTRLPFKSSHKRADNILDIIHSDLCGPMETSSIGKARYFLTFIDDHSRKIFVYFLRCKSEVSSKFEDFKALVENQTERKIKVIRTDNGTEYFTQKLEEFCRRFGIQHQHSVPYTPEQNGIAERANRTIVERAKGMLFDAGLEKPYWAEAVNMSVYIINRSASSFLNNQTPEESWR